MKKSQIESLAIFIQTEFCSSFADTLADIIGDVDFDLDQEFFSPEMVNGRRLLGSDLAKLRDLDIRAVLAEALPKNVSFRMADFISWSEDVAEFCSLNSSHASFSELLSVDKNYSIILHGMTEISQSSKWIVDVVRRDTKLDTTRKFYTKISNKLLSVLEEMIQESYVPTLRMLSASILKEHADKKIIPTSPSRILRNKIKSSRSFKDQRGAIRFGIADGRLEMQSRLDTLVPFRNPYKPLMQRALSLISNQDIMRRIDNQDRILVSYIREYTEVFEKPDSDENAVILYAIGGDIASRLEKNNERNEDEKIDGDAKGFIQAFVVANSAFVQGYPSVKTLMDDMERTRRSYTNVAENDPALKWQVLTALVANEGLFSDKTKIAISKLSSALETGSSEVSSALVTMGMGAMRGSLHTMAGALLDGEFGELKNAATSAGRIAFKELVRYETHKEVLPEIIITFITQNEQEVLRLAHNLPIYFSWLKTLVDLVRVVIA